MGNPITIVENITLNWINGRQLNSYTDQTNTINYKYNVDGIRISKTVNNVQTNYYLEGKNIIIEQTGENMIYYNRSNVEGLIGFKYNNEVYYYMKNNQDDIIGILDSNYNVVARYKYDSWGNIISITDENDNDISNNNEHIGNINPYRYRSYYYDKETKLYYLNSRYYNPRWGRFINAGGIISMGDIIEGNLYSYCTNDPINKVDSNGQFSAKKFIKNMQKKIKKVIKKVVDKLKKYIKIGVNSLDVDESYVGFNQIAKITKETQVQDTISISENKSSSISLDFNINGNDSNMNFSFDILGSNISFERGVLYNTISFTAPNGWTVSKGINLFDSVIEFGSKKSANDSNIDITTYDYSKIDVNKFFTDLVLISLFETLPI